MFAFKESELSEMETVTAPAKRPSNVESSRLFSLLIILALLVPVLYSLVFCCLTVSNRTLDSKILNAPKESDEEDESEWETESEWKTDVEEPEKESADESYEKLEEESSKSSKDSSKSDSDGEQSESDSRRELKS